MRHDLAGMCAKADGFLDAIGVDKADRAGGALAELARGLKLKALGGRGGAALVVADFKALGLDPSDTLLGLMSDRTGAPSLAGVPVVAYLPGADPAALLAEYEPRKDGALWTFQTPAGAMQAGVRNGYTLVSAMPAALQWALAATKPIAGRLTRQDLDVITRNDAAAYVDMAVASRIYVDFVFQTYNLLMQKMVTDQAAMAKDLRGVVEALCQDISQMTGASAGLRFEKGGVVGEMLAAYEPQSVRGRFHTGGGVTQRELLHRLPVMPYWVAFGADWSALGQARVAMATQQGRKFAAQWRLFTIVAEAAKMTMPPAVAGLGQQIEATWTAFGRQVSGVQLVVGPGAGGEGSLAGAVALTCADAGEVRSLLARATELADKAARVMFPLQEGAWLSYTRSAGGEGVDQIELTLPEALQAVVHVRA
ncbi:MAG: hypothetical protein NTV86_05345, partial [Planctomycetota bacterium]|nr:hypothetical protein [Planctomycetota bacterium]